MRFDLLKSHYITKVNNIKEKQIIFIGNISNFYSNSVTEGNFCFCNLNKYAGTGVV